MSAFIKLGMDSERDGKGGKTSDIESGFTDDIGWVKRDQQS